MESKVINRISGLDYLRGLAATGIMIYHYMSWTIGKFDASSFLGRVGLYGVSIFYILSGLTLYSVYHNKMTPATSDLMDFFKKRGLRIFPLLWLAVIITVYLYNTSPDAKTIFLNLTGLFGFFEWDRALAIGAWSIGNELVFYVFFPSFVFLAKKAKWGFHLFAVILIIISFYFSFFLMNNKADLMSQWSMYINPLNQIFLFLGGYLLGYYFDQTNTKPWHTILLIFTGLFVFILYPVSGDEIELVTGINRYIFAGSCMLITFGFYKFTLSLPVFIGTPLKHLGEISYGLYLLHPIFYELSGRIMKYIASNGYTFPETVRLLLAFGLSIGGSYIVYHYFEKYFMRLGRKKVVTEIK